MYSEKRPAEKDCSRESDLSGQDANQRIPTCVGEVEVPSRGLVVWKELPREKHSWDVIAEESNA